MAPLQSPQVTFKVTSVMWTYLSPAIHLLVFNTWCIKSMPLKVMHTLDIITCLHTNRNLYMAHISLSVQTIKTTQWHKQLFTMKK